MSKHTPGPWTADIRGGCLAVYAGEKRNCLSGASGKEGFAIHYSDKGAEYNGKHWDMDEEAIANAHLIAAAPELLEALEMMVGLIRFYGLQGSGAVDRYPRPCEPTTEGQHVMKADAVIAKAKGEA